MLVCPVLALIDQAPLLVSAKSTQFEVTVVVCEASAGSDDIDELVHR
jgi:hypothetical protein